MIRALLFCLTLLISLPANPVSAAELRIAVASNFAEPADALAKVFEQQSTHTVLLSIGSTGKHYAQITHGAPFDLFFAADAVRPLRLEYEGHAVGGTRYTYAYGKLVLWSPTPGFVDDEGNVLERGGFQHLAIANPQFAPYGMAARDVLEVRRLWDALQPKLVRGENIGQAYQYVSSGNAELGFVAYSQVKRPGKPVTGSMWDIPDDMYAPIRQQAVLLRDSPAAREFLAFVRSDRALKIIRDYGYDTP